MIRDTAPPFPTRDHARTYRLVGTLLVVGLILVALMAFSGARGPGLFTDTAAFFGLGLGLLLVAVALTFVLFTMRAIVIQARREHLQMQALMHELRASAAAPPPPPAAATAATGVAEEKASPIVPDPAPSSVALAPGRTEHARAVRAEPAIEIEGIGDTYARRLESIGVRTIGDLRAAPADDVARALGTHPKVVRQWQSMGELMEVRGIGKQFAELLVRAGVGSPGDLAQAQPEDVLARIERTNAERKVRIQGAPVGLETCRSWVENAQELVAPMGPTAA